MSETGRTSEADGKPSVQAKGRRKAAAPDAAVAALASQLFARLYEPGGGRTAEYYATLALDAAEVFCGLCSQKTAG